MIYLLKKYDYTTKDHDNLWCIHTKHYQHIEMSRKASEYDDYGLVIADIGCKTHFVSLENFSKSSSRIIIDPYNDAAGGGLSSIPDIPYPIGLFRCALGGEGSEIIPSSLFDITFSISVIEHIGQAEANYDCKPTVYPPVAQEEKRDGFIEELYRITKSGGITLHTVDHAARNLSFVDNFLNAGWEFLDPKCSIPSVNDCLQDEDAIRQRVHWTNPTEKMKNQELHSCLFMGFRKP